MDITSSKDVRTLRELAGRIGDSATKTITWNEVLDLADGTAKMADRLEEFADDVLKWQEIAGRHADEIERTHGEQATVEQLAVSVWGVREAHDLARSLLAEYDVYPKRKV